MHQAVCNVPVSAVRSAASHKSEMVTQLLFGEGVDIQGQEDDWVRIKNWYDEYEGWVPSSHVSMLINEIEEKRNGSCFTGDWVNVIMLNGQEMYIPFGCDLSIFKKTEDFLSPVAFSYSGKIWKDDQNLEFSERLTSITSKFINTSYLWGGRSVFGIDCSGFTQTVFRLLGIPLKRDAYQQAEQGDPISFEKVRTGDVAFFENENNKITHVGILLNDHEIIHASGKVQIDFLDKEGITNTDTNERTHQLTIIKRYF